MAILLDVNVLIALAWPNHIHHRVARQWFRHNSARGWATAPPTEAGFVRVSANRKVVSVPHTPAEARSVLREIVRQPHHHFWSDPTSFATSELIDDTRLLAYRQVSDAHLIALALHHRGAVATFDRGLLDLVPGDQSSKDVVVIIQ